MEDQLSLPIWHTLQLTVRPDALPLFTTVLQSGIEIKTLHGTSIAKFLNTFPGVTAEYLADTVQTIFLDGTAVDDLSLPLTGTTPVLALSAAMPGLAGAIFRRNSFHSALRTETKVLQSETEQTKSITVTLKLFNSIARDQGPELLQAGVCLHADQALTFLSKRPHLTQYISKIQLGENKMEYSELLCHLQKLSRVNLNIVGTDD